MASSALSPPNANSQHRVHLHATRCGATFLSVPSNIKAYQYCNVHLPGFVSQQFSVTCYTITLSATVVNKTIMLAAMQV